MEPVEIIYRLRRLGQTQAVIAGELGVSHSTVNNVIHGRITSRRVAAHISKLLKRSLTGVFPDRYGSKHFAALRRVPQVKSAGQDKGRG